MIEAVAVSRNMNCPKLILTHFSSRYGISNNCVPKAELEECANELNSYLSENTSDQNIFRAKSNSNLEFKDIDIWFAYDLMSVRYGNMHTQEKVWPILKETFKPNSEVDVEKINEKKEIKRIERLAFMGKKKKKKRRTSSM